MPNQFNNGVQLSLNKPTNKWLFHPSKQFRSLLKVAIASSPTKILKKEKLLMLCLSHQVHSHGSQGRFSTKPSNVVI